MATNKRNRRNTSSKKNNNVIYIRDNIARDLDALPYDYVEYDRPKKISAQVRRNREKASYMTLSYTFFLVAAIGVMLYLCASYLTLQSDITARSRQITRLERQLNDMKLANDEEYARIMGAVDLEKIKQTAMVDLGMTYPSETQIVSFADEDSDYVRQYGDIPK